MRTEYGPFAVATSDGVAVATFDRPPVNAVDLATYEALRALVEDVGRADDVRVLVLTAPETSRAWCGGADLHDFRGISADGRRDRYDTVNTALPALHDLDRPVIAAVTGPAVGVGVLLAAVCDLRIAAEDAHFSCPEIDYGLVAGSSRLLTSLGMPEALVREMTYTAARVDAQRMLQAGFLNRVVPRAEVLPAAMALAGSIAARGLPVLRARKSTFVAHQQLGWLEAYRLAQAASAGLVELDESRAGVEAFLDRDDG